MYLGTQVISTAPIYLRLNDPAIRNFYLLASTEEQELFDERAAIIEYDGRCKIRDAEYKAFAEVLKLRRAKYAARQ